MSQRIINVCDAHTVLDQRDVAGEQVKSVTRDFGDGPRVLELCPCEEDRSMKQMRQVYAEAGREPEPQRRVGRPKGSKNQGKARARDEYSCRFCSDTYDSPQGRGMHEFRTHPWQRLLWEEQTGYRDTHPQLEKKHIENRERRMALLDQMGVTLVKAAELEKKYNANPQAQFDDAAIDSSGNRLRLNIEAERSEQNGQSNVTVTTP